MTDYVRELQSLELALQQAEEHGYADVAATVRGQIPGAVATCRRELARLEADPPTYGSADYAHDDDQAARYRAALAAYPNKGGDVTDNKPSEKKPAEKKAEPKRGPGRSRKENTADTKPKETT